MQKTIRGEVKISGVGLHTGEVVNLTIKPAPANHGYKFCRVDQDNQPIIKADVDLVVSTARGTTLEYKGTRIYTTEHVLAALYGLEIDNALIEMDGPEVPILDGSSRPFVEAILNAGIEEQDEPKDYFVLQDNITFEDVDRQAEGLIVPSEDFRVTVMVDYNSPLLGTQHASMYHMGQFQDEIAPCRTFVFLRELEALHNAGLIKGGDVDNAIVMVDTPVEQEQLDKLTSLFDKPNLKVEGIGYLNNLKLRFENEPARHKLLDIVGDLALVGKPIKAHILAARPGHATNVQLAKLIKDRIKKRNKVPKYDTTVEPLFDINGVKKLLPHRYPMLMVDKVIHLDEEMVVGVKNVTQNEAFFQGHFPDQPIFPGVLIMEALAQAGGILVLNQVEDPENYLTYFMKMDGVKFKKKVVPGDTLILQMKLASPIRRGICHMVGTAIVGEEIVAEGELMALVEKVKENESERASVHSS